MYHHQDGHTIVRKHFVLVFIYFIKFIFILFIALVLFYIGVSFKANLGEDISNYIFLPLVLVMVNYSFLKLIFGIVEYYNYLFVISGDQIFVINSSLILRNDIEVIDTFKIVKLDAYSRGFFSNLFGFGQIIIETQTKEERTFRFMPKPYVLLDLLKHQRNMVLEDRKRKYVIDDINLADSRK